MSGSNRYNPNNNEINQEINNTSNHGGMAIGSSSNIYVAEGEIVKIYHDKEEYNV